MGTTDPAGAQSIAALQTRVAELEASNAALSAETSRSTASSPPEPKQRLRAVIVVVFLVTGTLLLPVAAVAGWARGVLTDTDAFVATFAPLGRDPVVQAYVTDQVVAGIDRRVNIEEQVDQLAAGLVPLLQDRPAAVTALNALRQPAADGIRSAITRVTNDFVTSDRFASAWEQTLRLSHQGAVNALQGDPNAALSISDEGLGIRLDPIIERVKQTLTERGFTLAASIPAVDRTIVLVRSADFARLQTLYRAAVALGTWLPVLALALLAAAVLLARRRVTILITAAILLGLASLLVLGGLAVGRMATLAVVPSSVVPGDVVRLFYDTATNSLADVAIAAVALAVVIAVIGWFAGPYSTPRKVRGAYADMTGALRRRAEGHGLSTGRFGEWLGRSRTWLCFGIAVIAVLYLLFNRPLTPGMVTGAAIVALIVILLLNLLSRPVPDRSNETVTP